MTVTACTLAALLSFEAASAVKDPCELTDDRCKAALYERRSVTAATADHRARYLFTAHNLYLRLFDKTGDPRDLCSARRAIEASLAIDDQPDTLRSESEALRTKLLERAKQQGARCASKTKRRVTPADAPLVARGPAPEPAKSRSPATSEQDPSNSVAATEPTTTPDGSAPTTSAHAPTRKLTLLADADAGTSERPADVALMPVASGQVLSASSPAPGRGLMIAGGVTLGVGAALTAAAGVMGHRAIETRREADALHEMFGVFASPDGATQGDALVRDFNVEKSQTVALALAGGTTIVIAAVLATVGARRMSRSARRMALVPGPGGLVFRGRF